MKRNPPRHQKVIRSRTEYAELLVTSEFIPAVHHLFGWQKNVEPVYRKILKDGFIKPAGEVGRQGMFIYDVLAGDDANVFLSLFRKPIGLPGPVCRAFVFDTADLIDAGAQLGEGDLLSYYEKAVVKLLKDKYEMGANAYDHAGRGRQKFASGYYGEGADHFLDDHFYRWDGEERVKITMRDIIDEVAEALHGAQEAHRLRGKKALGAARSFATEARVLMGRLLERAEELDGGEQYERSYRHYQGSLFADWPDNMKRWVALRDVTNARGEELTKLGMLTNPEVLWPGRLPVNLAVAVLELPDQELAGPAINWPDDLLLPLV